MVFLVVVIPACPESFRKDSRRVSLDGMTTYTFVAQKNKSAKIFASCSQQPLLQKVFTVAPAVKNSVNENGLVFLGAENGGLFVSNDRGDNWLPIGGSSEIRQDRGSHWGWWHGTDDVNYGLRVGGILDIAFDADGHLLLGTWDGLIRSSIPMNGLIAHPDLVVGPNNALPGSFLLSAYPNPFNGILRVSIDVENGKTYGLGVYDASGRLVEQLVSGGSGSRSLIWNASQMATGQYFLKATLSQQASSKTIPVLLMK